MHVERGWLQVAAHSAAAQAWQCAAAWTGPHASSTCRPLTPRLRLRLPAQDARADAAGKILGFNVWLLTFEISDSLNFVFLPARGLGPCQPVWRPSCTHHLRGNDLPALVCSVPCQRVKQAGKQVRA